MPQFPSSKYSASPAAGTFVRAQGSHSPMVEAEVGIPDFIQHPFRITARVDAGNLLVKVRAGTVNNVVPRISGDRLDTIPTPEASAAVLNVPFNVYLEADKGASPVFFPSDISVILTDEDLADTNDEGYLLLGTVTISGGKIVSINQYVYASQVLVRAKPGDDTALWLWSSR